MKNLKIFAAVFLAILGVDAFTKNEAGVFSPFNRTIRN